MKKFFYAFCLISSIVGCAASSKIVKSVPPSIVEPQPPVAPAEKKISVAPIEQPVPEPQPEAVVEPEIPLGKVFAKTDFSGVAQTSYVKLSIVDLKTPDKSYQLLIGDKSRQRNFPWGVEKTVMPSYFFIELPFGLYAIRSIAIPVGTTMADEPMDVVFEVTQDRVNYLGTLKVAGIREQIRLGGVPVIKPGFDYRVRVLDERDAAARIFRQRYPAEQQPVQVRLMQVKLPNNFEPENASRMLNPPNAAMPK